MSSSYYKYCIVPQCKSTTKKTPEKLFIYAPNNQATRKKWLTLAGRSDAHYLCISNNRRMYFCEDHFDLPNDMLNYIEYHIMGKVSQVRMVPGCAPSKFECQEDRRKRKSNSTELSNILLKQRKAIIEECLNKPKETCAPSSSIKDTPHKSSDLQKVGQNEPEIICEQKVDRAVQALITNKSKSKSVQTNIKTINQTLSPIKPSIISSSTSPLKVETVKKSHPSVTNLKKNTRNMMMEEDHSDGDMSLCTPSLATCSSSPSVHSLKMISSSDCGDLIAEGRKLEANKPLLNTIKKIEKKPHMYIGVSSSCYYLIEIMKDTLNVPKDHILLCLNKIRLDNNINELIDDYGITSSYLSKIFLKNIPLIASFMRPFIVELDRDKIKKTLPMAFRHNYYNVSCIIDCLEIEVQKPSKIISQTLTWSDYKKAYTIKYLISSTPNGLVNYISPGFGGRTTDTCMVESCDFVKTLKSGMVVMVNRGFKHIEQYLQKYNITLVRPPSVETGVKIERIICRLCEFNMLKPHACINNKFVRLLDDIIIIACALINLQASIVK